MKKVAYNTYLIDSYYIKEGIAAIYLIVEPQIKKFLLVDCGTSHSVAIVEKAVQKLGMSIKDLTTIVLTHVHLDHGAGAGLLMQKAPDAKLYIHPKGHRHIIDPSRLLAGAKFFYGESVEKLFGSVLPCPKERVIATEPNAILDFYGRKLQFHFSPGHAKHHMSLWDEKNKLYFAGDSAAIVYPNWSSSEKFFVLVPSSPTDFNPELWRQTLKEIREKKPEKIFITHFGVIDNIKNLLFQTENCLQKLIFIALENRNNSAGKIREQKITADIMQMVEEELQIINPDWQTKDIRNWYQKDCRIAALGLDDWLSKQNNS